MTIRLLWWKLTRIRKLFTKDYWVIRKIAGSCKKVPNTTICPRPICIGYLDCPSLSYEESDFVGKKIFWVDVEELPPQHIKQRQNAKHGLCDGLADLKYIRRMREN